MRVAFIAIALACAAQAAKAADIHVMISSGFHGTYARALLAFLASRDAAPAITKAGLMPPDR